MGHQYDVAIIGAGTAGLSALREVRRRTENFVLINAGEYGTTCARVGCMPSKALIEVAKAFHHRKHLSGLGIGGADRLTVDLAAVLRHVRRLRDGFVAGVLKQTEDLGERNIPGRARFVAPDILEVNGQRLRAKKIIVATGSRPVVPAPWRALGACVLTTDELFEQDTLPPRMAVVGLGAVGAEMAQALSRLGLEVTGFDTTRRIAGLTDPAVNEQAIALLRTEFAVHLGREAELTAQGNAVRVRAGDITVTVDKVLAALGRRPNLDDLGLEHLGVRLDERGLPPFDPETLQIADLPVYIAGDANAHLPLLHEAADEGYIAGYNAVREKPQCFIRRTPLAIVFTDPNIAVVGRAHETLKDGQVVIGEVDFKGQGRMRMSGEDRGLLRLYAARDTGRLIGAELCAPRGEHLAHLLALAIQAGLDVPALLRLPFYHPAAEEGLRTALRNAALKLTGVRGSPDLARCGPTPVEALD